VRNRVRGRSSERERARQCVEFTHHHHSCPCPCHSLRGHRRYTHNNFVLPNNELHRRQFFKGSDNVTARWRRCLHGPQIGVNLHQGPPWPSPSHRNNISCSQVFVSTLQETSCEQLFQTVNCSLYSKEIPSLVVSKMYSIQFSAKFEPFSNPFWCTSVHNEHAE